MAAGGQALCREAGEHVAVRISGLGAGLCAVTLSGCGEPAPLAEDVIAEIDASSTVGAINISADQM